MVEDALNPVVIFLGTRIPSLYHVITGVGKPDALQLKLVSLPREIKISAGGFIVMFGGDFSKE